VADWNRRILSAVEAVNGPDSSDYEMVGGKRKSERKKPSRKSGGGTNHQNLKVKKYSPVSCAVS
jgi:hypothetical protein